MKFVILFFLTFNFQSPNKPKTTTKKLVAINEFVLWSRAWDIDAVPVGPGPVTDCFSVTTSVGMALIQIVSGQHFFSPLVRKLN